MKHSLNIVNGKILLKHDSNVRITDGVISGAGKRRNNYSNNADYSNYFWASKKEGRDPSNNGKYEYFCEINPSDFYNMTENPKGFDSIRAALKYYRFVGCMWGKRCYRNCLCRRKAYADNIYKIQW